MARQRRPDRLDRDHITAASPGAGASHSAGATATRLRETAPRATAAPGAGVTHPGSWRRRRRLPLVPHRLIRTRDTRPSQAPGPHAGTAAGRPGDRLSRPDHCRDRQLVVDDPLPGLSVTPSQITRHWPGCRAASSRGCVRCMAAPGGVVGQEDPSATINLLLNSRNELLVFRCERSVQDTHRTSAAEGGQLPGATGGAHARPGHHPAVLMALAMPRTRLRRRCPTRARDSGNGRQEKACRAERSSGRR
jgi:hypothetical protein